MQVQQDTVLYQNIGDKDTQIDRDMEGSMPESSKKGPPVNVGGQAVIEGVMMVKGSNTALAVRTPEGDISLSVQQRTSLKDRYPILALPFLRGIINFAESMASAFKYLMKSAEIAGQVEEAEPSKFEKWLARVTGGNEMAVATSVATVIAVAIAIGLFVLLPAVLTQLSSNVLPYGPFKSLIEGLVRLCILLLYIYLVSKLKDIQRVFQYHGAEHKSIFCYEAKEELTPENAKKYSRFHPRCGTSFLLIMVILSIIIFSFVTWENILLRVIIKIILIPVIVGIGYELLRFSGKHQTGIVRILCWPGLQLQRLTTREPNKAQLEVALAALKAVLDPKEASRAESENVKETEESSQEKADNFGKNETNEGQNQSEQTGQG